MSEEDINFLISIQDLEQPDFDNACLERENEKLRNQLQQKENIIKEVREYMALNMRVKLNEEFGETMQYKTIYEILDKGE